MSKSGCKVKICNLWNERGHLTGICSKEAPVGMRNCAETTGSYLHTVYSIPFEMCLRHLRRWRLEMVFCFICSVKSCLRSARLVCGPCRLFWCGRTDQSLTAVLCKCDGCGMREGLCRRFWCGFIVRECGKWVKWNWSKNRNRMRW